MGNSLVVCPVTEELLDDSGAHSSLGTNPGELRVRAAQNPLHKCSQQHYHHSPKVGTTQMPITWGMVDKMWSIHTGIEQYSAVEGNGALAPCDGTSLGNMTHSERGRGVHANKVVRRRCDLDAVLSLD